MMRGAGIGKLQAYRRQHQQLKKTETRRMWEEGEGMRMFSLIKIMILHFSNGCKKPWHALPEFGCLMVAITTL
jgi:hypothetical protein